MCVHLPSILCVKPASLYLPKVTLLPTSSLGLTSRCAESGCNPTLPGLPHRPTQKPEPTDHHSALSNPLPCQEGAPCEWQVTLVCRGQKASLSCRVRESSGPNLGFLSRGPQSKRPPFPLSTDAQAFLGAFGPRFLKRKFLGTVRSLCSFPLLPPSPPQLGSFNPPCPQQTLVLSLCLECPG